MGANLRGFILVGPVTLDEAKIELAISRATKIRDLAKEPARLLRTRYPGEEEYAERIIEEFFKSLDNLSPTVEEGYGNYIEQFYYDEETAIRDIAEKDPVRVVNDFLAAWKCEFRNTCGSQFPERSNHSPLRVVFAGEITYGDDPTGDGWAAIKNALVLDILQPLGIE